MKNFRPQPPFQQQTSPEIIHHQDQTLPMQLQGDQTYTGESKPTKHPTRTQHTPGILVAEHPTRTPDASGILVTGQHPTSTQDASSTLVTGSFGQINPSATEPTSQSLGQPSTESSAADLSLGTQDTIWTLVNEHFGKSYPSADESVQRPPEGTRPTANDVTGSPGPHLGTTESTSYDQSSLTNKSGRTVSPFMSSKNLRVMEPKV